MATPYFGKEWFSIRNAPGPFRLVAEEVKAYEKHGNRLIVEFMVFPFVPASQGLLGHRCEFKVSFEAALRGATTTLGHGVDEPRNVRFLGRFVMARELFRGIFPLVPYEAADELTKWQWEAVFNPQGRTGMIFKLDSPLPKEWTL